MIVLFIDASIWNIYPVRNSLILIISIHVILSNKQIYI